MADGRLTTHVLDTALGKPAVGLKVELFRVAGDQSLTFVLSATTNSDGRVDSPLLAGDEMKSGVYELRFHAGDYLRQRDAGLPQTLFLDIVPIRFGVSNPSAHYHVPLLLSPFGYSTYRGS